MVVNEQPPQRVLFTGGLGRSGSTLIEKLLNELPPTFSVGETIHLWERGIRDAERCGCGEPFWTCPHWSAVGQEAFGGWERVDLDRIIDLRWSVDRSRRLPAIMRAHRTGSIGKEDLQYLAHLRAVLLASATITGADVLLESSKHLSTAALLSLDPTLDVRVLHLVRDPRGVAYSWTKEIARPEAGNDLMPTYRPSRTAGRWVTDNLGFELLGRLGVPTLTMRYEDFLEHPATSLQRIATFAGLGQVELPFLDRTEARLRTPMHSIAGNPLRFGGADLTLRLDDAWRTELDDRSRRIVAGICAPALKRYGYSISA
jgi:hypothetical protein